MPILDLERLQQVQNDGCRSPSCAYPPENFQHELALVSGLTGASVVKIWGCAAQPIAARAPKMGELKKTLTLRNTSESCFLGNVENVSISAIRTNALKDDDRV